MKLTQLLLLLCIAVAAMSADSVTAKEITKSGNLHSTDVDFFNSTTNQPVKTKFWYLAGEQQCGKTICLAASQNKEYDAEDPNVRKQHIRPNRGGRSAKSRLGLARLGLRLGRTTRLICAAT